ncbi:DNA-protecting protein DprA [Photobacterium damselae subsp. piscicida]|uniref:DNA-protecting protein DprA n=2 Tax=Photobacterium damselae TaxID=38293 RepID=A0A1V1VEB4_PHODP|nr:DNA-protecting protein DprA [Photobacterium damselae subsp. piscicida]PSV70652.1 DNA-processing protein DprA [Photobacterium damselae]PSW77190.1 DNA-processing protein DprA [Photobacterium damselae]QOD55023.1 DNA-protecting protein DprA [Photobacterium damselae subsp. piscicida]QOD58897.1 DNA-protecting protein DprA [Photobacterium damselae subsp. piscicida]
MTEEYEYWRAETVAFYALQSLHGVGFRTLYKIASQKISFRELIRCDEPSMFSSTLRTQLPTSVTESEESWDKFKKELWSKGTSMARINANKDIKVVFYGQDAYPERLKHINNPPMWLFVQGALSNLHAQSVAIVGSRKSSDDGHWLTKLIVAGMANEGLVSVSGLADGIDQTAHIESIRFNVPTVAVLGTGIDSNYPKGSETLREQILSAGGTIVTEYLIGQSYSGQNFVQRNRIQAGLATCVIPVEWKIKSGTAHTVNFAKDFNRYLVMPYLPDANPESDELKAISSYKLGVLFNIPTQTEELITFLRQPSTKESIESPDSDLNDGERQISLGL